MAAKSTFSKMPLGFAIFHFAAFRSVLVVGGYHKPIASSHFLIEHGAGTILIG
jgi:hypothetical protein